MIYQSKPILAFARTLALAGVSVLVATAPSLSQIVTPIDPVETASGTIAGQVLEPGVKAWLGVPFAQPPVNELRWQAPQPIQWEGTWNADRFGAQCIQVLRPHNINHFFGEEPTAEDCLFMNIWAPEDADETSDLPVVVFIYGGGGTIGSSTIATYRGQEIAKRGAIFVSFNYRVGAFGFMAHPELTEEQGGHSGNYAHLDQNAALKWIQDNIAQFGGDPDRVVITGQSAGARAVSYQLFSPLSEGLFSGAMMSSGCSWDVEDTSLADGEAIGLQIQEALGVDSLAAMRDMPADKILAVQNETQVGHNRQGIRTGAVIDGYFLPASMGEIIEAGGMNDVPVIAHFNNGETSTAFSRVTTADEYRALAEELYGDQAEAFLAQFPVESDDEVAAQVTHIATASRLENNARNCAIIQNQANNSDAYISMFSRNHSFGSYDYADIEEDTVGAYHTADIPFWFGTLEAFNTFHDGRNWSDEDRAMAETMMDSLVAFAATGEPSTEALEWSAWTPENEVMMEFGETAQQVPVNAQAIEWLSENAIPQPSSTPAPGRIDGVGPRD